jgi:DNA-binding NarL/FixJ family response regulator
MTIRVLLADGQKLVRASFAILASTAGDMEVVAEAGTGREATVHSS